jgi:hypothetical protein
MSGRSEPALIAPRARALRAFAVAVLGASSTCFACAAEPDTIRLLEKSQVDAGPPGCKSDADCSTERPHCEPNERRCVECLSAAECAQGMACSSTTHTCESNCTSNADCAGIDQKVCNADGACVECSTDDDCAATPATSHCNPQGGVCVQCLTTPDCNPRPCFDDCFTCSANVCVWRT